MSTIAYHGLSAPAEEVTKRFNPIRLSGFVVMSARLNSAAAAAFARGFEGFHSRAST
jgi:hypothetical protein